MKGLSQLLEIVPKQMSAKSLVEVVNRYHVWLGKERLRHRRLQHVHKYQVLARQRFDRAHEALREHWIIQLGEEDQQRPAAQTEAQKTAEFFEIRRDNAWLQAINRVPT